MVDYSKFDKLAKELSDSEEDERKSKVKVTKLDKPTGIAIQGKSQPVSEKGTGLDAQYATWDQWSKAGEEDEAGEMREYVEDRMWPKPLTTKLGTFESKPENARGELTKNGMDNGTFLWNQTADEVLIRVRCPKQTRAKHVIVNISSDGVLRVALKENTLIEGKLQNGVWDDHKALFTSEDARFNKCMTWEITDLVDEPHHRCIVIRFVKRPPHEGVKVWWRRVFAAGDEKEVDVSTIASRNNESAKSAQAAWKQAHEMFLAARAKEREERRKTGVATS